MGILGKAAGAGAVALAGWTAWSFYSMAGIEQPRYRLLSKQKDYELREYEPYIVAETEVTGSYDEALRTGFNRLFNYISGSNTRRSKMAMTAPVIVGAGLSSEQIAMAAPVTEKMKAAAETIAVAEPAAGRAVAAQTRVIAFVMPPSYTIDSLPVPNNPDIRLRQVPARKVAAMRFSWYASAPRVEQKKRELLGALLSDGVRTAGEPELAAYTPPFIVPFLMRNEVMVTVE